MLPADKTHVGQGSGPDQQFLHALLSFDSPEETHHVDELPYLSFALV